MAFESPADYIAFFGAVVGVAGFVGGITASGLIARSEARHRGQHEVEQKRADERFEEIKLSLREINRKLDVDLEIIKDAISVIMIEGGQVMPEFKATMMVRSPHTYRYFVLHERKMEAKT